MSSKKIYLIRHGQTDFNLNGIVQGSGIDSTLNQLGLNQARAFYECYKNHEFDKVYTSSLQRSIQSVKPFIETGTSHEPYAGLNEINWGNKEGTKITIKEDAYYQWLLKQWQDNVTSLQIEGGESPEDVAKRQQPVLDLMLGRREEKKILVCMHGRAIRIMLCQLLNYPLSAMDVFEHSNLGLYILNFSGSFCKVESYNNTTHLNGISAIPIQVAS